MFNRSWGAQVELPLWNRTFTPLRQTRRRLRTRWSCRCGTARQPDLNFGAPPPNVVSRNWAGLGDLRLKGIYTGFSEDLSSGLTFGVKLPTGSISHDPDVVDRDTQISSGSTDILLGGFHRDRFGSSRWNWFAQAELDLPVLTQGDYRPGFEADAAAGIYYDGLSLGRVKFPRSGKSSVRGATTTTVQAPRRRIPATNACCCRPASSSICIR